MKLTVIVTVYNEASTILAAIQQAKEIKLEKQIIIVDNFSTDGTREKLRSLNDPSLEMVYQPENFGYGCSVITGMNLARGEYLFVHNSDLEYDPNSVYEMVKLAERDKLDVVFGSRLLERKRESKLKIFKQRPFYLGTLIATGLTNLFYGKKFTDIIGNRFYRTASLRELTPKIYKIGFDFEVASKLGKYDFKVAEIPVKYKPRNEGKKIKPIDIIPAVWIMFWIKFFHFNRTPALRRFYQLKNKRILIIRTDRFGEFILNLPAIRAVRRAYPQAHIAVMVNLHSKELIESDSDINEVIVYDRKKMKKIFNRFKLFWAIRKKKFNLAIILNPAKLFNILTFLCAIPVRLGYNRKWPFLLTHWIDDRKYLEEKHEIEYNLDLVRRINIDTQDSKLSLKFGEKEKSRVSLLLEEYGINRNDDLIAVHPWTSDTAKQWPLDKFSQLTKKLKEDLPCKVVIIGGSQEVQLSSRFCNSDSHLVNLTGRLTLLELAVFFTKCCCLVSNDSGPVHLACAVNLPVAAIFKKGVIGKSSKRWGPRGNNHIVIEEESFDKISVDDVFNKVKQLLQK